MLRHGLVRPEIQFKAFAQGLVIHLADGALPGSTGIGHYDVHPAERRHHGVEGGAHALRIGDVAFDPQRLAADLFGRRLGRFGVEIQDGDFRAFLGKSARRGGADARAAAGDHRHLAGQSLLIGLAQLGLFQRPVFYFEHVEFADAAIFADRFGIADHRDGVLGDVGGDGGILGAAADTEHAHPRHQDDARQRIQFFFLHRTLGVVLFEIAVIARHVTRDCFVHILRPFLEPARFGRGHDHRPVLGADGMVGRHHAHLAVAHQLRAVHIIEDLRVGAEIQNLALGGACVWILFDRHRAAQDGRDFRHRGELRWQLGLGQPLALTGEPFFRQGDEFDHPLIGLPGAVAHSEDAVLQQH